MKKIIVSLALASALIACKSSISTTSKDKQEVKVAINLTDVKDDKVQVTIYAPKIKSDIITYSILR